MVPKITNQEITKEWCKNNNNNNNNNNNILAATV